MERLRVAQVAPLWASVPPTTYGGTERMVHLLTEELVQRGYDVTLFASGDSRTTAKLQAVYPENLFDAMARSELWKGEYYQVSNIAEAFCKADDFDVIHCHLGCFSIPLSFLSRVPVLHSLPSPLETDDLWVLRRYPEVPVTARSRRQVAELAGGRNNISVVYNGLDFEGWECPAEAGRYLAFLGRMAWSKAPHEAIAIAKKAGLPIVLAGEPWYSDEQAYFAEQVRPLIDGKEVVYMGPVDDAQKKEFLAGAAALLFPIQWEEPFGIVMIEAMACGAPVVACNRGSVSEVVDFGETGFYADSAEDLPALVPKALALDRRAVREQARRRFSHQRMTDEYVKIYESLVRRSRHGSGAETPAVLS